jgi:hypothetical protein
MKLLKRLWHFETDIELPDTALARQVGWSRGNPYIASVSYPEPCNLIAASAWTTMIPKSAEAIACIIFKCRKTGLWIQSVATNEYSSEAIETWLEQQLTLGAVDVWSNKDADQPRLQKTIMDRDDDAFTGILVDMSTYKIGDLNLMEAYPERFGLTPSLLEIRLQKGIQFTRKKEAGPRTQKTRIGIGKPVLTPHGIFKTARAAGVEFGVSCTWVSIKAREEKEGFRYLTEEECLAYRQELVV